VPISAHLAGLGVSWKSVSGQLLASGVLLLSGRQDLRLRAPAGAAFGFFMVLAFGTSALAAAIRVNLLSGAAICAVVLCFEAWLILYWILHRQDKTSAL
jgi:hypothetical protein